MVEMYDGSKRPLRSTSEFMSTFSKYPSRQKSITASESGVVEEKTTVQLPPWKDSHRSLPNEIVRSALFNARNRKTSRVNLKKAEIYVLGGGRIVYTGEELRQDDQTVWLQLIHLAKQNQPLGGPVEFTPYSFCKSIEWAPTGKNYERLRDILNRLQATSLEIYSVRLGTGVSLSMVPMFRWRDHASNTNLKRYQVVISPELLKLFGRNDFTKFEWKQRLSLPMGIATWLHGYFASHKNNYPLRVKTIGKACGIDIKDYKKLKQLIGGALKQLMDCGFLSEAKIIDEMVKVKRKSQA